MQKTAGLFLTGRISAELCSVYLDQDVFVLCTCVIQARQSLLACSDWILVGTMCLYLGITAAVQQDSSWDARDGWVLGAQVHSMVQSAVLLGTQVTVGKVLHQGLGFRVVTAPYLTNPGASRPEVTGKDMAMLHC